MCGGRWRQDCGDAIGQGLGKGCRNRSRVSTEYLARGPKLISEVAALMSACEKKRRLSMGGGGVESINTDAGQARYEVGG